MRLHHASPKALIRVLPSAAIGMVVGLAFSATAYAVPIQIKISSDAFPFPDFTILTDSKNLSVGVFPPDPEFNDPGNTSISGDFIIGGPDPGPPSTDISTQAAGIYTFYQEYEFNFNVGFPISDLNNFLVTQSDITSQDSTYKVASYEVFADKTFQTYQDGPTPFTIFSFQVSAIPLPASAPMFGAALLALGAVGYGIKRKKVTANA